MDRILKFGLKVYFGIFFRVKITGMENVPKSGGAILCSNHIGALDMFFVNYKMKRLAHFMAKIELFENPIIGRFLRSVGLFPVKREVADIGAVKTVYKLLKSGEIVGILPEGTRSRGKTREETTLKAGAAMFAVNANVPIIPVFIEGTFELFSKVRVVFGEPYYIEPASNKKYTSEEFEVLTNQIMDKVYSLMGEK